MRSYIGDTMRRLLAIHTLEERLEALRGNRQECSSVQAQLESLRAHLPLEVALGHDRFRRVGQRSVAEVRQGVCTGCRTVLSAEALAALKDDRTLHRCGTCGRYNYLVEEEESDQAPLRRAARQAPVNRA